MADITITLRGEYRHPITAELRKVLLESVAAHGKAYGLERVTAEFGLAEARRNCMGPEPGRDVTVVQTQEKTLFVRSSRIDDEGKAK